ncbi:toxin-antitoxin system, toxin component, PIN family protein [Desulfobacula sp.]
METAKSLDMILVTNNIKEFERIDDLHMENWVE